MKQLLWILIILVFFENGVGRAQAIFPEIENTTYERRSDDTNAIKSIYKQPYNDVWEAVLRTIEDMKLVIESARKDQGLIITRFYDILPQTLEDISQESFISQAIWKKGEYSLTIKIATDEYGITDVTTVTHVGGYEKNATQTWHLCLANDAVANRFHAFLGERLRGPQTTTPQGKYYTDTGSPHEASSGQTFSDGTYPKSTSSATKSCETKTSLGGY